MRLTGGGKATVVRVLGWKTRRFAGAEYEPRDGSFERCPVLTEEAIMAFHPAFARFQDAEALILVHPARHDRRLFANDAFPDDFGVDALADGVVNQPAAREQLCGELADVFDAHEVREHVMTLRRLRMIAKVNRADRNTNSFRFPIEERSRGHDSKLVAAPGKNERGVG